MNNGYAGRILRVDLSSGEWETEDLDDGWVEGFIGGRGLGVKILLEEVGPNIEPLTPENKLILMTGPLTGTGAPYGAFCTIVSKSPLTGAIGYDYLGGHFGPELKFAGYDEIIVEGKAEEPVWLLIQDDAVELRQASHLWGKTTSETEEAIRAEVGDPWTAGDTRIAAIGPAGEKMVRFAAVVSGGFAAGRTGPGAVMGSKNLKAIAVRGTQGVRVADAAAFKEAVAAVLETARTNPITGTDGSMSAYGTAAGTVVGNRMGILPTRNFHSGLFESFDRELGARSLARTLLVRSKACFSCPSGCRRISQTTNSKFEGRGEGPEYDAVAMFGPACGVSSASAVAKSSFICNELGMDVISAGNTLGCAMDLYERGFLPEADAGCRLNFGNAEAMIDLLRRTGLREGFGDVLAEGAYRLAEKYGHPEVFIGAKKMEAGPHDPRSVQAMGLTYATSNRGACHNNAHEADLMGDDEPDRIEGKAERVKDNQDMMAAIDSLGLCQLALNALYLEDLVPLFNAATGLDYTLESTLLIGERIWNTERLFNLKAGFKGDDDTVSRRLLEEPMPDGPARGDVLRLDEMLPEYYRLRGWDQNGIPGPAKLSELGLR